MKTVVAAFAMTLFGVSAGAAEFQTGTWPGLPAPPSIPDPEQARVSEMAKMLKSSYQKDFSRYKELCAKATSQPRIGMSTIEARSSRWCFPLQAHKTTTAGGEHVQESYANKNGSISAPRRYLYFDNGILTAIQE